MHISQDYELSLCVDTKRTLKDSIDHKHHISMYVFLYLVDEFAYEL